MTVAWVGPDRHAELRSLLRLIDDVVVRPSTPARPALWSVLERCSALIADLARSPGLDEHLSLRLLALRDGVDSHLEAAATMLDAKGPDAAHELVDRAARRVASGRASVEAALDRLDVGTAARPVARYG